MKQQKQAFYAVVAVIVAFGIYLVVPKTTQINSPAAQQQVADITYQGIEGKNALELLKAGHQVETQAFDFGEMVQSIDGRKADSSQFWSFYVNGQQAQVGAGDYQTKSTDSITWKLETIQ